MIGQGIKLEDANKIDLTLWIESENHCFFDGFGNFFGIVDQLKNA